MTVRRHVFRLSIAIDSDIMDSHDGEHEAPPNDPADWDGRDLFLAAEKGLTDPYEAEVEEYEGEIPA